MRHSPWRSIAFVSSLLIAVTWGLAAGWQISRSWPMRDALAKVDLARDEAQCSYRSASAANQQRCRDLVEIMSNADTAEDYFADGLVIGGPALLLIGFGFWIRRPRGDRTYRAPARRRSNPDPHHHHRISAA